MSDSATSHEPVPRYRTWQGWPVLSQGFRPFFLLAGLWAMVALNIWLHSFLGLIESPGAFDPLTWHTHEMLFGYAAAVLAGFLLTAIPNWTGRLPLQGWPLAGLVGLWIAGRLAMWFSDVLGPLATALIDLAFLTGLLAVALREILAGKNWRNLPLTAALAILIIANAAVHAGHAGYNHSGIDHQETGTRIALAVFAALITLVGGRIVPSFTRNWLVRENPGALPAPFSRFDRIALAAGVAALLSWIIDPGSAITGVLCALAAFLHAVRLARWHGTRTWREPLLVVLHVGYAWLPISFAFFAAGALLPDVIPAGAGIHALTVGAIATMTLAVMSRAIRGHSGRSLTTGKTLSGIATTGMFVAITLAALLRVGAPFFAESFTLQLMVSSALWEAAFLAFVLIHARAILLQPR